MTAAMSINSLKKCTTTTRLLLFTATAGQPALVNDQRILLELSLAARTPLPTAKASALELGRRR